MWPKRKVSEIITTHTNFLAPLGFYDPDNHELLALAFFFATSAGDIDNAARLAEKVVAVTPEK